MTTNPFSEWLRLQDDLQKEAYGISPGDIVSPSDRADFVTTMALATTDELHEALNEFRWKPWANGRGDFHDVEAYLGELVDALHFIGNMILVTRGAMTPELLGSYVWDRYKAKHEVNKARQERPEGYDDKANQVDGRAQDEPVMGPNGPIQLLNANNQMMVGNKVWEDE